MKRIKEYKKLFSVEKEIDLKILKKSYRDLVKEWHPDKFQDGDPQKEAAEIKSRQIIDGYHFLVSIAPETKAANLEEYIITTSESGIADYHHKGMLLEISFLDGNTYEYFGVPKNVYIKMVNSDKLNRFAKRNIFNSYLYRKSKKTLQEA
ncbi:KTSC domain-containing protein [Aquimarina muelleri]|uniref:Molecular chaperone DnaJ n=1 Tax=Aquimarina muelleri TaxID=279356 RepID=A0A918N270_9FLAO|nr:KTSC domain-containing protein [Aquimarina muelleri]MCX2763451.1 KTSC domain-containing protein [Aquimarina muelleri]GGX02613.1 molecular chaperone DnaJ [Aquimarina muelleri]